MTHSNNFSDAGRKYLTENRHIRASIIELQEQAGIISYGHDYITFAMKDLDGNHMGTQERYIIPTIVFDKEVKSKTQAGSKVGYFYTALDYSKPVIVTEGEIDRLTISHIPNTLGIQGIANLKKLTLGLIEKGIPAIYLLVDNDDPANQAIGRLLDLSNEYLQNIYDSRTLLGEHKDCNEHHSTGGPLEEKSIYLYGKSLADFKSLIESFYINQDSNRINHQKFAEYLVQHLHLASANENLFMYKNGIWHTLGKDKATNLVLQEMKRFFGSQRAILSKDHTHIFNFLLLESYNEYIQDNLMRHSTHEICLDDCIHDIGTKQLRAYKKEDYKFQKLPYHSSVFSTYTAPQKRLTFLNEITEGINEQEKVIDFLQEYIGWLFVANAQHQKALLIHGSGANGKGVLLGVIKELLGQSNCSSIGLHEINKDQYLYNLIGKLCNIDSDMQQNTQLDSGIIKKLVSGESVSAKMLYKQPIEFLPYARLLIATNELPYLKTIDDSMRRRFIFLPLKQSFLGRENINLTKEILEEKNQIFARSIYGLERLLKRNHFIIPDVLHQEIEKFIKENDTIEVFMEEFPLQEGKIYIHEIYDIYKSATLRNGLKALTKQQFNKRMTTKGYEKSKDGGGRYLLK